MKYILSYPKTGRTWLRYTLGNYFKLDRNLKEEVGFANIDKIFYDYGAGSRDRRFESFPEVCFGHVNPSKIKLPNCEFVIFIFRDVVDTLVSFAHHLHGGSFTNAELEGNIDDLSNFYNGVVEFKKSFENYWIICYRDINKKSSIEKILEKLGETPTEFYVEKAIDKASFDNMREDENWAIRKNLLKYQGGRRVRKGVLYTDEVDKNYRSELKNKIIRRLSSETKRCLTEHKCL